MQFARQMVVLDEEPEKTSLERRHILTAVITFGRAAVEQLRQKTKGREAGEPPLDAGPSDVLLHPIAAQIGQLLRQGRLAPVKLSA